MRKKKSIAGLCLCTLLLTLSSCQKAEKAQTPTANHISVTTHKNDIQENSTLNSATAILQKEQVPVLCYHRIAESIKSEYSVTPETFQAHMQILADSGYHSISPEQLYNYLAYNKDLPQKPVMITFDDSRAEHSEIAAPVLEKLGFRGVFFIMTITYDKKNYMTKDQIATLARNGHTVGLHSWDHTMATKYKDSTDWNKEVAVPKKKLEAIIGKKVDYWAYPNGVCNHLSATQLSTYFRLSFQLSGKRDSLQPLQTVRRIIVPNISNQSLLKSMHRSFDKKKS